MCHVACVMWSGRSWWGWSTDGDKKWRLEGGVGGEDVTTVSNILRCTVLEALSSGEYISNEVNVSKHVRLLSENVGKEEALARYNVVPPSPM